MAYTIARTAHPLIRFLSDAGKYGPLPVGPGMLFYVLYGQWRLGTTPQAYMQRPLHRVSTHMRTSVQRWREALAHSHEMASWADRGLLFTSPGEWPSRWPDDWPPWVCPTYLHRSFGATNRLASTPNGAALKRWTAREGLPELFAYAAGVPLTRPQRAIAVRGARALLQAPQFLVWAYNVPTHIYPRTDISPLVSAGPIHHLRTDPLATEDEDILKALPYWMLDPAALTSRARPFNVLRTRAPDYVRYPEDDLLGRKGRHLDSLPSPKPRDTKMDYAPKWARNRLPLYLTA